VVGTRAHAFAEAQGFTIRDASGRPLTRRPGANPNVVAALIDFSNPAARAWWSTRLASLIERGVAGFKADFGEQLPERAVLHSGETGGAAHNRFVRYYLEATAAAFGDKPPAIISRSGNAKVRTQIWSGDQTSDFCPKSGLPAAIRAAQSASLSGFSFVGSDVGGYFGTPTTQVFVRWSQFACFTPMMQLHGLGCREPWQMEVEAFALFRRYASLHLELLPYFTHHGRIAAQGGAPLIRMMPLAFPDVDWSAINDWDQQFMLGDALLVAPVAFYANTRAVYLPEGVWYDVMAGAWTDGGRWVVRETPLADIPVFIREGSHLYLRRDRSERSILAIAAVRLKPGEAHATIVPEDAGGMPLTRCALLAPEGDIASADEASALETHHWLGQLATLPVPPGRRVSFSLR
jgi:alpha-D-xyloside xylohydrolase